MRSLHSILNMFPYFSINIIIITTFILLCSLPRRNLSQSIFGPQSDVDVVCSEMEKSSEESLTGKNPIHGVTDDEDDDDEMDGDKYEPILITNSSRFVRNSPLMVNISSEIPFRVVILQARLISTGAKLGHFIDDSQTINQSNSWDVGHLMNSSFRILNCGDRHKSHHHSTSPNRKNATTFPAHHGRKDTMYHWVADGDRTRSSYLWIYTGDKELSGEFIYFVANICSGRSRCLRNITSMIIRYDADSIRIDTSECGKSKGCFRYPGAKNPNCDWWTCQYFLTYHVTNTEAHFEMSGKSSWIAVGFSSDNRMGGDDVFMCVRTRSGVEIRRYVTELGHVTPTLIDKNPFFNTEVSAIGIDWTTNPSNVTLTCRFSRPLKVMYDQSSVDLSTTWYQLYAWGPISSSDTVLRHAFEKPLTSNTKITLKTSRNEVSSQSSIFFIPSLHLSFVPISVVMMCF